jgi:hypothetical protein
MFDDTRTGTNAGICQCCGQTIKAAAKPRASSFRWLTETERADLTNPALFAYHKKTAPLLDLRFLLKTTTTTMPADVRQDAIGLLATGCKDTGGTLPRADFYAALKGIQNRWRRAANIIEKAERRAELDAFQQDAIDWLADEPARLAAADALHDEALLWLAEVEAQELAATG